jgi:hypothetical protein
MIGATPVDSTSLISGELVRLASSFNEAIVALSGRRVVLFPGV